MVAGTRGQLNPKKGQNGNKTAYIKVKTYTEVYLQL